MTAPDDEPIARAIAGALRAAIHAHGPITLERIGSATKRILGSLRNAPGGPARLLGQRRFAGSTAEERRAFSEQGASKGGTSAWAGVTKAARSAEMKRRAAVRKARRRPGGRHDGNEIDGRATAP